jgi:hypothetical protein
MNRTSKKLYTSHAKIIKIVTRIIPRRVQEMAVVKIIELVGSSPKDWGRGC